MKVVLDTNVLIAALIARGVCAELFEHCVLHHELFASEEILSELNKHLTGKFKYTKTEAAEATTLLRTQTEIVVPSALEQPICRDPDDDMVLGTALSAGAHCIVTGDKDLLVLGRHGSSRS
jgi:putative PIN family toxin of toxin-antitoxin system